ncbi:MAG: hypothetical protein CMI54_02640 [Parcubacteria group bacterium]|nr:hypothetical protein [Parcubacteria group bacterium]
MKLQSLFRASPSLFYLILDMLAKAWYSNNTMAHPAHKIKLKKGDLIVTTVTGNTFLLVERFKGEQGHHYWKILPSAPTTQLKMLSWLEGPLKIVRELSIRHNFYNQPKKFRLIRKGLDK